MMLYSEKIWLHPFPLSFGELSLMGLALYMVY